jgi:glycosyltransferase involved in cell wall biosynthesis
MLRILHNMVNKSRRSVLRLVMLVPERIRARLSQNPILMRIYLFLDRAKYIPVHDPNSRHGARIQGGWPSAGHHPEYRYQAPEFSMENAERLVTFSDKPLISVLIPVYNTRVEWLEKAIGSIYRQWYENWEICIADDCSDAAETLAYLTKLDDPRITIRRLEANSNIARASNVALSIARGEYVALLDHDDELTADALYAVVRAINETGADFIYSDEDKIGRKGKFVEPHFKPNYSPEQFHSQNYLSHLGVVRKSIVDAVGGFTPGTDGAQDYDLYLKVLERTDRIVHIPKVLYHWRKVRGSTATAFSEKSWAQDAGITALRNAMARRGLEAEVQPGQFPGTYRVKYAIEGAPLVSIVIPFKDRPELIRRCVHSILEQSTWRRFEVVGVSNNSVETGTFEEMERLAGLDERIRFVEHNVPFNFSEINNFAVRAHARGEHVLMLNNDIEIISPEWIESLLEFSQRPDVGVVGARLYYPDGRLQHAGAILGIGGVAGHSHKYFPRDHHGYFSRPHIIQNVSAVTAACCMVERRIFDEVSGLDEQNLTIAFNDIDFCLRVREAGYLNVYTPYCEAWHHESITRGRETTAEKQKRFEREVKYMLKRHAEVFNAGDPYYNPNLTLEHEDFSLKRPPYDQPTSG